MRCLKRIALLFVVVLTLAIGCVPAYATDGGSGGDSHIQIEINGNGITINPGQYPDMGGTTDGSTPEAAATTLVSKGKLIGQTVTALCAIVCFVFFLINVTKLATSGGMPFQRRAAIIGVLWSGASLTLFGGAWVVISFFWNYLK